MSRRPANPASAFEHASLAFAALALTTMLSFPEARSVSDTFGWLPFWLSALPLTTWAATRAMRIRGGMHEARPSASVHRLAAMHSVGAQRNAMPQGLRQAA